MTGPTVVVSAGSYHLPFDRLGAWMEPWIRDHPEVSVLMQHGPGAPVPGAENHAILRYDELMRRCGEADAIVLQGGAGGVMDMRAMGRVPIVVPRVPGSGEVVDHHQLVFTERAEALGAAVRVLTRDELWTALDDMLAHRRPTRRINATETPGVGAVAARLERPPERLDLRRRWTRLAVSLRGLLRRR